MIRNKKAKETIGTARCEDCLFGRLVTVVDNVMRLIGAGEARRGRGENG